MKHGSLFSGIGGFDLAAEWMGWENIFHCEWNEFGQKVLKYYWPDAKSYTDITKTDFSIHRGSIDILTGGFPCQPYSQAGKRKGKEDERHLWPEMLRAIREIQPVWVVGENVLGLVNWSGGLVFHEVQTDLEAEGYEVFPYVLPACSVNAPHRRDRVWFVAYSKSLSCTNGTRNGQYEPQKVQSKRFNEFITTPNTRLLRPQDRQEQPMGFKQLCEESVTTNTGYTRLQRGEIDRGIRSIGQNGNEQFARFIPPTWENFPTQSPLCTGDDGISSELDGITFSKWRNESIKAAGNAIVPQVVYQIFKSIEQAESSKWKY